MGQYSEDRDPLNRLRENVDSLRQEIYGDRLGETPGMKRRLKAVEDGIEEARKEREKMQKVIDDEQQERDIERRARELEGARRDGQVDFFRVIKQVAFFIGSGGIFAILAFIWRALSGQG